MLPVAHGAGESAGTYCLLADDSVCERDILFFQPRFDATGTHTRDDVTGISYCLFRLRSKLSLPGLLGQLGEIARLDFFSQSGKIRKIIKNQVNKEFSKNNQALRTRKGGGHHAEIIAGKSIRKARGKEWESEVCFSNANS